MSDRKLTHMRYNAEKNEVRIAAKESEFVPAYVKYLLEYYNIPADAKIIFTKKEQHHESGQSNTTW